MCTSSTAQSPSAPAIITTTTTSNGQTSSGVGSGVVSGGTATEARTLLEDTNYVQVMSVPDAIHCSEDLPEESETMRLTQEQTVPLQKVDGPSLIGTNSDHDVTCLTDFTHGASVESNMSRNRSTSGGSIGRRSLRSTPTHSSPRGQRSSGERSTTNEELLHQQPITLGTDPPTEDSSAVTTATQMTSSVSRTESGDTSSTAGAVESLDSQTDSTELDGGSPRKQRRRAAAKPGRKTTTRQRTVNSKRKS